jgi:Fe-S-cluster containining protein
MKNIPCLFLINGKCSIYNSGPFACSSFPFQIGMTEVKIDGIEICPTATLIAEEIREFLKNPNIDSELVWEIKDSNGKKVDTRINRLGNLKMFDEISKPIEESYEKFGIADITSQGTSDIYETIKFLWFLESKELIGANK